MRSIHSLVGVGISTFFVLSCSLQKWDDVKRNNAGSAGVEQGGGGSSGEAATGGKTSKGGASGIAGSLTRGGSTAKNSASAGGTTSAPGGNGNEGGSSATTTSLGGTPNSGGSTGSGGTKTTSGATSVGAPYVVSVTPANGADGVTSSSKIVVKFSEAMDTFSVASALTIPPLANNSYSQVWSADNTTLTIAPSSGLIYATGVSAASTPPQVYTVTLSASASDAGGTAMGQAYTSSFKTLRRITQTMVPEEVALISTHVNTAVSFCNGDKEFTVGPWDFAPYAGGTDYIFVHFSFASLGALKSGTNIESAVFNAKQTNASTGFYPNGSVVLDRFEYHALDKALLDASPSGGVGTLCDSNTPQPSLSVFSWFYTDFQAAKQELLYRLSSSTLSAPTGSRLSAYFNCSGFNIVVTLTTP